MLTPPVLGLIPRGLLSFFKIQNGGRNPQSISDVIAPTIDLFEAYRFSNAEHLVAGPLAVTALGNFTFAAAGYVVPQNEGWWLNDLTLGCQVAAADIIEIAPALFINCAPGGTQQPFLIGDFQYQFPVGGQIQSVYSRRPVWMPPGSTFGLVCRRFTGASFDVYASISLNRSRV